MALLHRHVSHKKTSIASCCRPPDNRDSIYLDNLQTYLAKILAHKGAHIWLGGYLNLSGIDWQNENIKHNSQHTAECHQLLDISETAFLDQLVLEPTRITEIQTVYVDTKMKMRIIICYFVIVILYIEIKCYRHWQC